jgi:hypothetical protein
MKRTRKKKKNQATTTKTTKIKKQSKQSSYLAEEAWIAALAINRDRYCTSGAASDYNT